MMKLKRRITDGWHEVAGYTVYVEDGKVIRGLTADKQSTTYPYRWNRKSDGWDQEVGITVDAFRSGVRRETITMR